MRHITLQPLLGGMSLAAEKALGTPPIAIVTQPVSNTDHLIQWYKQQKQEVAYVEVDSEYTSSVPKHLCQDIDIVTGTPVCAGLSSLNSSTNKEARGGEAKQNDNMINMACFALETFRPKVYCMENAPNLYSKLGDIVRDKLQAVAKTYGYSSSIVKTNTILHGLPHNRNRTFYFFWKSNVVPVLNYYKRPLPEYSTFYESIPRQTLYHDATPLTDSLYTFIKNKYGKTYREEVVKHCTFAKTLQNNKLIDEFLSYTDDNKYIKFFTHVKNKISQNKNYWDDTYCYFANRVGSLTGKSMRSFIHPTEERTFDTRELMSLMGLPYDFMLTSLKDAVHLTQNVPVNTAADWLHECKLFCEGKLSMSTQVFMKQNNIAQRVDTMPIHKNTGFFKNM